MTDAEIDDLHGARAALARKRNALAVSLGNAELASPKAAEDLTRILLAIEAVDRALAYAGRPYMPIPGKASATSKSLGKISSPDGAQTSASRAKERVKAAVEADRDRRPRRAPSQV